MFSHIMGYKHRQMYVEEFYRDDVSVLDLSQAKLLDYARKHAENGDNLNDRIKTRRSDEVRLARLEVCCRSVRTVAGVSLACWQGSLVH